MAWTKWLVVVLVLLAGVTWAFPDSLSSFTDTELFSGYTYGNVLGYIAILVGLWSVYEMTMKK